MNKRSVLILFFWATALAVSGQPLSDNWKGFQRVQLSIAGHDAWYVRPSHPLSGNPWVLRASFPAGNTGLDSLLLAKGFSLAYIATGGGSGSPGVLQTWDRFYRYLTDSLLLAGEVALEAVGRGDLFVYDWAQRNPDKVTCIYADCPVRDSNELAGLKAFKVPIHAGGDNDTLAPAEWADWMIQHSYPVRRRLPYTPYYTKRMGLSLFHGRMVQDKRATVAFLGGSITYNPGWRDKIQRWLRESYPQVSFRFISAGIPSLGSPAHAFRIQQDVLDSGQVDLLFVEAAVNDRGNGTDSVTQLRSLEGIVEHARNSNPYINVILMSFADPLKTADYKAGIVPKEVSVHEEVARRYGFPSVDLAREISDKLEAGEFSWKDDFKDIHPSPFGQELYFATIRSLLENCFLDEVVSPATTEPRRTPALDKASFDNGSYLAPEAAVTDGAWQLVKDWSPAAGLPVQKGFVHVPVLEALTPGARLSLSFKGTAVGIAVNSGPDAGTIGWSVDGGREEILDLFTPWSGSRFIPWYLVLSQGLKRGKHKLRIRIPETSNKNSKGTACRIVHFLVNQ